MTVSGLTMMRVERQFDHNRDNQTHRHRSPGLRAIRFGVWFRWSTVSCWRNAMFSACNAAWPRRPVRRELSVITIRSSTAEAAYERLATNQTIEMHTTFSGSTDGSISPEHTQQHTGLHSECYRPRIG